MLAVGSLALQCLSLTVNTRSSWLYTTTVRASNRAIYREYCRRRESWQADEESQVLSEIYRVGVGCTEAREWETIEGDSQGSEDHRRSHAHGRRDDSESLSREFCVSLSALLRVMLISTYIRKREKAVLTFAWKRDDSAKI